LYDVTLVNSIDSLGDELYDVTLGDSIDSLGNELMDFKSRANSIGELVDFQSHANSIGLSLNVRKCEIIGLNDPFWSRHWRWIVCLVLLYSAKDRTHTYLCTAIHYTYLASGNY